MLIFVFSSSNPNSLFIFIFSSVFFPPSTCLILSSLEIFLLHLLQQKSHFKYTRFKLIRCVLFHDLWCHGCVSKAWQKAIWLWNWPYLLCASFSEQPLSNVPLHAPVLDVATALEQMSHLVCVISVVEGDLFVSKQHACPSADGPCNRNMLVGVRDLFLSPESQKHFFRFFFLQKAAQHDAIFHTTTLTHGGRTIGKCCSQVKPLLSQPPQTPLDSHGIPSCHLSVIRKALEILSLSLPPPKTHTLYIHTDTTLISLSHSLMERIQLSSFRKKTAKWEQSEWRWCVRGAATTREGR